MSQESTGPENGSTTRRRSRTQTATWRIPGRHRTRSKLSLLAPARRPDSKRRDIEMSQHKKGHVGVNRIGKVHMAPGSTDAVHAGQLDNSGPRPKRSMAPTDAH